jgi:hypothetical protein
MSNLFNRPAPGECSDYFRGYVDLIETDDILKYLKKQGLETMYLLRSIDDKKADFRYAEGKWSIKDLVGHLIDMERLFAFRSLWAARGVDAAQPGIDEDEWAATSNATTRPWPALWREQHVSRTDHVYLWRSFDARSIDRRVMADGHELSVRAVPWIAAGHERHHLDVLYERYGLEKQSGF